MYRLIFKTLPDIAVFKFNSILNRVEIKSCYFYLGGGGKPIFCNTYMESLLRAIYRHWKESFINTCEKMFSRLKSKNCCTLITVWEKGEKAISCSQYINQFSFSRLSQMHVGDVDIYVCSLIRWKAMSDTNLIEHDWYNTRIPLRSGGCFIELLTRLFKKYMESYIKYSLR